MEHWTWSVISFVVHIRIDRWMFIILLLMRDVPPTSPSPLPESIQQQLGKIGVAAGSTEKQEALGTPGTGHAAKLEEEPAMVLQLEREVVSMVAGMAIFAIPAGAASSVRSGR